MNLVYLVMESDIETSNIKGVYSSLDQAIKAASVRKKQLEGWDNMTVSIDVWPVGGGYKVETYNHEGK